MDKRHGMENILPLVVEEGLILLAFGLGVVAHRPLVLVDWKRKHTS